VLIAFVLSLFFKTPPLRAKSALQEAADDAADAADAQAEKDRALTPAGVLASAAEDDDAEEYDTGIIANRAAAEFGALIEPGADTASTRAQRPRPAVD
jgi:hypothetical protein